MLPPMTTSSRMREASSGWRRSSVATLVSGPTAMIVTGSGLSRRMRCMRSTACSPARGTVGGPSSGPSRPLSPCTSAAVSRAPASGRSHPAATGTPVIPASVQTRRALSDVFSSVWLPATVVIALRSIAGSAAASMMASASSCPGSQSRMTGVATSELPGQPADRPAEQGAVARPGGELVRAPVRADVRRPGEGTAPPHLAHGEQRVLADGGDQPGAVAEPEAVVTEQGRPGGLQAGDDRVVRVDDLGLHPLRGLDPVVVRGARGGEHRLDRGAAERRLGLEALERQVAAGHGEAAALLDPLGEHLEPVRGALARQPGVGVEQDAV